MPKSLGSITTTTKKEKGRDSHLVRGLAIPPSLTVRELGNK